MKKTNYYVLSLLMAAGLAACSAEIDGGGNDGLTPISLTATVEDAETTRAGTAVNNAFSSGDAFTAYFPENVRIADATTASSTTFNYNGTEWTPTTQPYFNAGTTSATIHAYYGKVGGASGTLVTNSTTKFTVATNQSTDAGYKASDLMYATNTIDKASPTTALTFSHKMAKIIVNATAGDGISQIQAVRIIGGHRSIDVTMPGCTLGTTLTDENSSSSYITMYSGGTTSNAQCAALVVPEASGFTGDFLEIVTDQGSVKYSLTDKVLNSGKSYTFVLAVTAAAIGSTVAITGWTDSADATITAGGGDFIMGDIDAQTYNGSAKTPTPTVSYNGTTLTKDTHYTLQYVNNTNAGTAAVYAIGKGSYVGKVGVKEFTINMADNDITLTPSSLTVPYQGSATSTVSRSGDGAITVSSSNNSVATASVTDNTITVNYVGVGDATITVNVAASANYNAASTTLSVTCPSIAVGMYLNKDGSVTSTMQTSGNNQSYARVCYVGSVPGYFDTFLAIALEDASSSYANWSTQMSAANTWASNHPVTISGTTYNSSPTTAYDQVTTGTSSSQVKSSGAVKGWRVPSVTDWKYVFAGIGGKAYNNSAVSDGIFYSSGTDSGSSDGSHRALLNKWCGQAWNATTAPQAVRPNVYWSSSEQAESTDRAWDYDFGLSKFNWLNKTSGNYVRAVFAY